MAEARGRTEKKLIYRYVYILLGARVRAYASKPFKRVAKLFKAIANFVNLTRIRYRTIYANHISRIHINGTD